MRERIVSLSENFWTLRGSFKIGGLLDIGTQAALVRRASGGFVLLDSYTLSPALRKEVDALTHDGRDIEAVVNLHPFHTVHVRATHAAFPNAKHYGTARHHKLFPELKWEPTHTEDPATHALFAPDLEFTVPRGVDFISADEKVHFSSVLALHPASRTLYVDDTVMFFNLPFPLGVFAPDGLVRFHLTLAKALERRAGAAGDFRRWAEELIDRSRTLDHLSAAHRDVLSAPSTGPADKTLAHRLRDALAQAEPILRAHEKKHG